MKNNKNVIGKYSLIIFSVALLATANKVFAYGMGISTFPLELDKKIISAEVTGVVSHGSGLGLQARYTQKLNEASSFDAGLGIAGGERSTRIFAGYDYELFPDYDTQPRTSIKAFIENSKEFESRKNILGIAPSISKGFSFWGHEAFPYLSLPYGLRLDGNKNTYGTSLSANIGVSGIIPREYAATSKPITANAEIILALKNSFSGIFFGFGYPLE